MNFITLFLFAVGAVNGSGLSNPVVLEPKNMTYSAGMTIPIKWSGASTGFVNIDISNVYRDVLSRPVTVASGVPAEKGYYEWKIPPMLKTAVAYYISVWGPFHPEKSDTKGNSQLFTIFNDIPNAVNNFIVLTPNSKKPCAVNAPCKISWDFPDTIEPPNEVHINLYRVGEQKAMYNIATVNAAAKSFTWDVPNDSSLLSGNVFIGIDGSGRALPGPKMANNMGANSQAFAVTETLVKTAEEIEAEKAEKTAAEEKAQKEAEEAEKKMKAEEMEKKMKEEDEKKKKEDLEKNNKKKPAGRVNQQSQNAGSRLELPAYAVAAGLGLAAMLAIF